MNKKESNQILVPLRDIVMFPGMVAPLFVGRTKSILALEEAMTHKKPIVLVTQKDANKDNPTKKDLHEIAVIGDVIQLLQLPDRTVKVLVEAVQRVKIINVNVGENYYSADVKFLDETVSNDANTQAYMRTILSSFKKYSEHNKKINPEIIKSVSEINDPSKLVDNIASHLDINLEEKQDFLSVLDVNQRMEIVYEKLEIETNILETEFKIRKRVKEQMEKTQKDYYLNEQMKAIQKEISEGDKGGHSEFDEISSRIKKTKLSAEAKEKLESELQKFRVMSPMSAEASITRNYIDTVLSLPWGKKSKIKSDLQEAQKVLDEDHYGLEKVKERIVEYLAVNKRTKNLMSPIICLVGPPGVGKTSLARSIAESTGRKFTKFALGGMRDEAEIRGHRKTYVGAMPGKILQLLKKTGVSNPVMLLDEIDKVGSDYRGDPSFALLEVLDPEQNSKFLDHYLELEYDLSSVMFIATANSMDIPRPLLDRMEVINLSSYIEEEKIQIATRHLVEKQKKLHGLKTQELKITDEAVRDLIRYYTMESGVRKMEKELAKICRKVVHKVLMKNDIKQVIVDDKNLSDFLGVRKYNYGRAETVNQVGVSTGLAYTTVGGELLSLEAVLIPGKGEIKLTGKLGEVMQESAQAAFSYFRSKIASFGVDDKIIQDKAIHIHVPEGAVPKDGPSAGITMLTAIVSIMTGIPVNKNIAMTGEITLRGRVLPIGGLKEKLIAALRGGITTVIIPQENKKDLADIPNNIIKDLKIICVENADQVLEHALIDKLTPKNKNDSNDNKVMLEEKSKNDDTLLTH